MNVKRIYGSLKRHAHSHGAKPPKNDGMKKSNETDKTWNKNCEKNMFSGIFSFFVSYMDQPYNYQSIYGRIFTKKSAATMTSWKNTGGWNTNLCILFRSTVFSLWINVRCQSLRPRTAWCDSDRNYVSNELLLIEFLESKRICMWIDLWAGFFTYEERFAYQCAIDKGCAKMSLSNCL